MMFISDGIRAFRRNGQARWIYLFLSFLLLSAISLHQSPDLSAMIREPECLEKRLTVSDKELLSWTDNSTESEPPSAESNPTTNLAAFVCVTGQIQRLELEDKINKVLEPLQEAGFQPYVALMITDEEKPRYTNKGNKLSSAFDNYTHAHNYLTSRGFDVVTSARTTQPQDPIMNWNYTNRLGRTTRHITSRATNHIRQFHTLAQCGKQMMESRRPYHMVIRIREDVGLTDPLRVEELHQKLYSMSSKNNRTIIASDCRKFQGMNDRMAVVTPEAAYDYFHAPFINWYTEALPESARSPETYLIKTYENLGVKVWASDLLRFVVKLEPTRDGSFVLMNLEDVTYCFGAKLPPHIMEDQNATRLLAKGTKYHKHDGPPPSTRKQRKATEE